MPAPTDPIKKEEWKKKISEKMKGRIITDEWKNKISQSEKGKHVNEETRKKISMVNKGRKQTEQWKKIMSEKMSGRKNPMFGKYGEKSPMFGRKHSEQVKIIISNTQKGRARTIEQRIQQSVRMSGERHPFFGTKRSIETKNKIKLARSLQKLPMRDSKPELIIQNILENKKIKFVKQKMIKDGNGFFHAVDIFIEPNICIEIDGDYWHANPQQYNPEHIIKTRNKISITAKQIWQHDDFITKKLENMGYKIIRIWEHEIHQDRMKIIEKIMTEIQKIQVVM